MLKKNKIFLLIFVSHPNRNNKYIFKFVNFLGVGSSPPMISWVCGGNFFKEHEASKWLHNNVLNQEIAELERQSPLVAYWFHVMPTGDLSYQSKGAGHQGCLATYFSVYWLDVT